MNTLHVATLISIAGAVLAILSVFTALYTYRNARRLRQKVSDAELETAMKVVVLAPEEERRYFLSVPPGLSSGDVVQTVAKALEEAELETAHREGKRSPAQPGGPGPAPTGLPDSLAPTTETTAHLADPDTRRHHT